MLFHTMKIYHLPCTEKWDRDIQPIEFFSPLFSEVKNKTKQNFLNGWIPRRKVLEPKKLLSLGAEPQEVRKWPECIVRNCTFWGWGWEGGPRCRDRPHEKIMLHRRGNSWEFGMSYVNNSCCGPSIWISLEIERDNEDNVAF